MTLKAIRELPRSKKLKLMEALSHPHGEFESPSWHVNELAETERCLVEGKVQLLHWKTAKTTLCGKFE
jgi:hypothetical protein